MMDDAHDSNADDDTDGSLGAAQRLVDALCCLIQASSSVPLAAAQTRSEPSPFEPHLCEAHDAPASAAPTRLDDQPVIEPAVEPAVQPSDELSVEALHTHGLVPECPGGGTNIDVAF